MRRSVCRFAASSHRPKATALLPPPSPEVPSHKLSVLHKLLTGEAQLRNKAFLKVCNLEHSFGANWKGEIEAYAAKLPKAAREHLRRQIARVNLTRYTTRELAMYAGEGPSYLDDVAREANLAQGKVYLDEHGVIEFETYVEAEAKNANWPDSVCKKFIKDVKALNEEGAQ
ncbi:unnamed protein product [Phytomonas sp. Hart1]|nr:unnamed protein product [Phytomonas sp. Hart1]|eukprot:CCW69876.1 unnamed protein product [Phytomonas sp. isolate Hart1]